VFHHRLRHGKTSQQDVEAPETRETRESRELQDLGQLPGSCNVSSRSRIGLGSEGLVHISGFAVIIYVSCGLSMESGGVLRFSGIPLA